MIAKDANPPGVVLAGGRSSRMGGRDKAHVPLGGKPLLAHVVARLGPQVGQMAINSNGEPAQFGTKTPVLADSFTDRPGPLAGILTAMDWARALGSDWVVTVATDTPFLPDDLVDRLARAQVAAKAPIVLAETADGLQPVTGLWYTGLADGLRGSISDGLRKVTEFTEAKDAVTAFFAGDGFFNVNTPEDLARAEEKLASGR